MSDEALERWKAVRIGKWTRRTERQVDQLALQVEDEGGLTLYRSLSTSPWDDSTIYSEWTLDLRQVPSYLVGFLITIPERLTVYLTQMIRDNVIDLDDQVQIYIVAEQRVNPLDLTTAFRLRDVMQDPIHARRQRLSSMKVDPDKIPVKDFGQSDEGLEETIENIRFVVIKVLRTDIPARPPPRPVSVRANPVYQSRDLYTMSSHGVYPTGKCDKIRDHCWLEAIVASVVYYNKDHPDIICPVIMESPLGRYDAANFTRNVQKRTYQLMTKYDYQQWMQHQGSEDTFFEMICGAFYIEILVMNETTYELSRMYGHHEPTDGALRSAPLLTVHVLESKTSVDGVMHWDAILNQERFSGIASDHNPNVKCTACFKTFRKDAYEAHVSGPKEQCGRCWKKNVPVACLEKHRQVCKGYQCVDCHKYVDIVDYSEHKEKLCPKFIPKDGETRNRFYARREPYDDDTGKPRNNDLGYMDEYGVTLQNVHAYDIESFNVDGKQVIWLLEIQGVGVFENDFMPGFAKRVFMALLKLRGIHYYYAHNGSGYDTVLMYELALAAQNEGLKEGTISKCGVGSKIKRMEIHWKTEKARRRPTCHTQSVFLDTMLLMPGALERLAKALNLPSEYQKKQLVPYNYFQPDFLNYVGVIPKDAFNVDVTQIEYDKHFKDKIVNFRQLILDYLHQDVMMLSLILEKLYEASTTQYQNSILGMMTVGQFAQDTFQRHDLFPDEEIPRLSITQDAFIRGDHVLPKKSKYRRRDKIMRPVGVYGGRTEIFHVLNDFDVSQGSIQYIDIKSSYPYQMATRDMPGFGVSIDIYEDEAQIEAAAQLMACPGAFLHGERGQFLSFVMVSLKMLPLLSGQTRAFSPWLPMHQNGKMVFSYQDRIGTYFSEELVRALNPVTGDGWIVDRVYERHMYERTQCLQEFMQWAYKRKEQWDVQARYFKGAALEAYEQELMDDLLEMFGTQEAIEAACKSCREFSKVFVNSLFGKFLQRVVFDKSVIVRDSQALASYVHNSFIKITQFHFLEGCIDLEYSDVKPLKEARVYDKDRNAAIGAAILAWGRIQLTEMLRHHGSNVIMCDTDSGMVYVPHGKALIPDGHAMGHHLGDWVSETEGEPVTRFCCLMPKTYAWECPTNPDTGKRQNVKAKGFSLRAIMNYSKEYQNQQNEVMGVDYFQQVWQRMWEARDQGQACQGDAFRVKNMARERRGTMPGVLSMHTQEKRFRVIWSELKRMFARDGTSRAFENGDLNMD